MTWTIFSVDRGKVLVASGDWVPKVRAQPWLCPPLCSKLTFPTFADAVSFLCLCYLTWLAHDSKLQPIKITQFFGTGTGKLKKQDNFWLPRKTQKECATKFMTLADYVIPRNKWWHAYNVTFFSQNCSVPFPVFLSVQFCCKQSMSAFVIKILFLFSSTFSLYSHFPLAVYYHNLIVFLGNIIINIIIIIITLFSSELWLFSCRHTFQESHS